MDDMEELRQHVSKSQPEQFLLYQAVSHKKRLEFLTVVKKLRISISGSSFLDIGPGYGDSLDLCYEMGAKIIDFVEIDPLFFTYNRLKHFTKGYRINHMLSLWKLRPARYDFIWVKGSVSADFFITSHLNGRNVWLLFWLSQLERLASPTCHIVICPHWANNSHKREIEDARNNLLAQTMLSKGYLLLTGLENHNHEPEYPITFYKKCGTQTDDAKEGSEPMCTGRL